jgi:hypothetical protein
MVRHQQRRALQLLANIPFGVSDTAITEASRQPLKGC